MANVSWSMSIKVAGGPTISAAQDSITVEATDRIDVSVAADASKVVEVNLQPGLTKDVHLLLIKSSYYDDDLTYKVGDGQTEIKLRGPQFFSGGTVDLLEKPPTQLKITNKSSSTAQIEIFIARNATPTP